MPAMIAKRETSPTVRPTACPTLSPERLLELDVTSVFGLEGGDVGV